MGKSFLLSAVLHSLVVVFAWIGMPMFKRDIVDVETPIVVELVTIAEVTAAPPPKPEPEPEPEPAPEPAPAPPPPEPEKPPPPEPESVPAPPEQVADLPTPSKVAAPPRKPDPPKKDSFDQLVSLVKDLEQEVSKRPPPTEPELIDEEPDERLRTLQTADRATLSERDAIRAHIENCWRIDPGKEGIQNLTVDIRVSIQPDGSVRQAIIEDTGRYFSEPSFRTFADSARTAVLSCSNIPISPQRYETFKEIVFTFTPQGRLN
ncbi:MAG: cell envelope integrity protein TolA [Rhodospirillaceae bacterium]|jgi:colicin import membrane protein|nr:cell envelope integrity protein TolA [Rhodospirillaceae bacterium]MBT5565540.1 cell envelope integrity protein TolA [Rhodospirillaceae bacterium]